MQILVNGKNYASWETVLVNPVDATFGQVMKQVSTKLLSDGQLVTKLVVDGGDITGTEHENIDVRSDIELIEITSNSPAGLIIESMDVISEWLEPLSKSIMKCADEFRLGDDGKAVESFIQVVDGFRLLMVGISQVLRLIQAHFPDINTDVILDYQNGFSGQLDELIEAQQNQDLIMLADLLEYEIYEQLGRWDEIKSAFSEKIIQA
jgi:hypothetical protein